MLRIDAIRGNDVYLVGDESIHGTEECMSKFRGDSRLFVKKTNIEGIYQYGAEQVCEDYLGHGKGYVWASRASVMNKAFNICLIEAYYKMEGTSCYSCCAIDLVRFEQMLNEAGYIVEWNPIENTDCDVHYSLTKRGDTNADAE